MPETERLANTMWLNEFGWGGWGAMHFERCPGHILEPRIQLWRGRRCASCGAAEAVHEGVDWVVKRTGNGTYQGESPLIDEVFPRLNWQEAGEAVREAVDDYLGHWLTNILRERETRE